MAAVCRPTKTPHLTVAAHDRAQHPGLLHLNPSNPSPMPGRGAEELEQVAAAELHARRARERNYSLSSAARPRAPACCVLRPACTHGTPRDDVM